MSVVYGMIELFNPLALRALPLYSLTKTQGERFKVLFLVLTKGRFYIFPCFLPLRPTATSPIAHACAGQEGDTFLTFVIVR